MSLAPILAPIFATLGINISLELVIPLFMVLIVAPISEEIAKFISISQKMGAEFLITFNVVEFMNYSKLFTMSKGIISIIVIILVRLFVVGMHYTTAIVQKIYQEKEKSELGLVVGMLIHFFFNMFAFLIDKPLVAFLVSH